MIATTSSDSGNGEQQQRRQATIVERGSGNREEMSAAESRAGLGLGKSREGCWEANIDALVGSIEPTEAPETEPNVKHWFYRLV